MDPIGFDRMAQSLATIPRRLLISAALTSASAFLLGAGVDKGLAKKRKKSKKCKGCDPCQTCVKGACRPKAQGAS